MAAEYETVLHRWFDEVWNQQRTDTIDELMSDETIIHGLTGSDGTEIRGLAAFKEFHKAFITAFPDLNVDAGDVIRDGEKMAFRCTVTGTHMGGGLGFAATNERVEFTGSGLCTFKNGKFTEVWNEFDFMKMHTQLGTLTLNF